MAKITYGSSSFDWGVSIQSSSGKNASSAFQGVVLSSDKSKLYIVFPFGSFTYTDASGLNVDQIVYFIINISMLKTNHSLIWAKRKSLI